jgi:alanine racemase
MALARINLATFEHNLAVLQKKAPDSKIMPIIKANAYGHGLIPVGLHLEKLGIENVGVGHVLEAKSLREAGFTKTITVLTGFVTAEELKLGILLNVDFIIHSTFQIEIIAAEKILLNTVWLKIDTGMHRLGFFPDEVEKTFAALRASPYIGEIKFMTHLAFANESYHPQHQKQMQHIEALLAHYPSEEWSIAKSGSIFEFPQFNRQWIRPGISLYGISPFSEIEGRQLGLKPAMSLSAKVIALKTVKQGESIGYGGIFTAAKNMRMAIMDIGYSQGFFRNAKPGTPIYFDGESALLVGRVCMTQLMLDISNCQKNIRMGEEGYIWCEDFPVESFAKYAGTTPYECVCGVSNRVEYDYIV